MDEAARSAPGATSSSAAPTLAAVGLWKRYRRRARWALADVNLSIPAGRIVALLGPNGAGKSTLLRTWLGFESATKGYVRAAGVDPWRDSATAIRALGYIPQQPSLYDELTVAEHVDLAAYLRRGFDRHRALARIDELELPRAVRAAELSGGQRAQLALALVLAAGASILLLDEPLASLDPLARRGFLRILTAAARTSGATVVLSSHIVGDIQDVCDELIILIEGRVRLQGPLAEAQRGHAVVEAGAIEGPTVVGRFPVTTGDRVLVHRVAAMPDSVPAPTLEELLLGYLAAAPIAP